MADPKRDELVAWLRKELDAAQDCAANNRIIIDAMADQLNRFEQRDPARLWNTYAVRLAVDHKSGLRREETAIAMITAALAIIAPEATP